MTCEIAALKAIRIFKRQAVALISFSIVSFFVCLGNAHAQDFPEYETDFREPYGAPNRQCWTRLRHGWFKEVTFKIDMRLAGRGMQVGVLGFEKEGLQKKFGLPKFGNAYVDLYADDRLIGRFYARNSLDDFDITGLSIAQLESEGLSREVRIGMGNKKSGSIKILDLPTRFRASLAACNNGLQPSVVVTAADVRAERLRQARKEADSDQRDVNYFCSRSDEMNLCEQSKAELRSRLAELGGRDETDYGDLALRGRERDTQMASAIFANARSLVSQIQRGQSRDIPLPGYSTSVGQAAVKQASNL